MKMATIWPLNRRTPLLLVYIYLYTNTHLFISIFFDAFQKVVPVVDATARHPLVSIVAPADEKKWRPDFNDRYTHVHTHTLTHTNIHTF